MTSKEESMTVETVGESNSNTEHHEHVSNVTINEKLLKITEPIDQEYDNEDEIEDYKSNIISLQQLIASKESVYEQNIQKMESDHRKKIEEFEAKEKKYNHNLRQNVQKCINLRKEQIEFMHLYTRAQIKIKMYENNYSIQEFVTNLLDMVDFYSPVHTLENCKRDCPDEKAHRGLKERIKNLEEGVKTVVTICSLKDTQMELLSSKIKRCENELNSYKQQLAIEIQEEDLSVDLTRTQKSLKQITYEKLQLMEKMQQLESKNTALSNVIQEVAGEYFKSQQLLKDDFSNLRRHVISLYSEETNKVMPSRIKDLIAPTLKYREIPLSSTNSDSRIDSNIEVEVIERNLEDIRESTDSDTISSVTTIDNQPRNTLEDPNVLACCNTGSASLPSSYNEESSYGNNVNLNEYSYNETSAGSYQSKKTKKTVSWSDKVNVLNCNNTPWSGNKTKGKQQRKAAPDSTRYRNQNTRSYQQNTEYDNGKDQEEKYTGEKHKQKNSRRKRQTPRWN